MLAVLEGLQFDDKRGLVTSRTGNEVETLQLLSALHGGEGGNDGIHLIDNLLGASHRSSRRHGDGTEHHALVFVGHKTGLRCKHSDAQHDNTQNDRRDDGDGLVHQFLYRIFVLRVHCVERRIERRMEAVEQRHFLLVAFFVMRFQEDGTESR